MKSLDGNPEMKTQVKYSTQVEKEIFLTNYNWIIKLWTRSFGSSSFVAFVCSKISPSWTCCVVPLFELCRLVEIDEVTVLILMIPGEICSDTFLLHYRDSRLVCKFLAIFWSVAHLGTVHAGRTFVNDFLNSFWWENATAFMTRNFIRD